MTENTQPPTEGDKKSMGKEWLDEAEQALERTGDALKAAWEGSRDKRMSALEAAKSAASELGAAIDRGVARAKESWGASRATESAPAEEEE